MFYGIQLMERLLQGDLIPGLSAKQPKVVAGCTMALKEIVRYVFDYLKTVYSVTVNDICAVICFP